MPNEDSPHNEDEEPVVRDKDEEDLRSSLGDDEHPVWNYMHPEESFLARLWLASEKLLSEAPGRKQPGSRPVFYALPLSRWRPRLPCVTSADASQRDPN